VERLLAFPRAPTGSVSVQVWGTACATIVKVVGGAVVAGWGLVQERKMEEKVGGGQGWGQGEKMKMGMGVGGGGGGGGGGREKKEL